jgi:hypothetical protein
MKKKQRINFTINNTKNAINAIADAKKNVQRIQKKTFYLQFCMGSPEGHQKSKFNTPKVKTTKMHMGSIRQSLQDQPKNIKKLSKHQINRNKKKLK